MKKILYWAVLLLWIINSPINAYTADFQANAYSSYADMERSFQGNDYQFGTTSSLLGAGNTDVGNSGRAGRRTLSITTDDTEGENTPGEWDKPQHNSDPLNDTPIGDGVAVLLLLAALYAAFFFLYPRRRIKTSRAVLSLFGR